MTSTRLQRSGSGDIVYGGLSELVLNGGTGGTGSNTFNVNGTAAATVTRFNGGAGDDNVNVQATSGPLYIDGGDGSNGVIVGPNGTLADINGLVNAYQQKQYQVVEGPVEVLHQQPASGHSKGDVIAVNGVQFEVNYFYATPAYRNTLAHGGVLGSGVYARIYYYNGEILRIDIRK